VACAGQDEAQLGPFLVDERERLEQAGVVLVRPAVSRV